MKRSLSPTSAPPSKRANNPVTFLIFIESHLKQSSLLLSLLSPLFPALSSEDLREVAADVLASSVPAVLGPNLSPTDASAINEAVANLLDLFRSSTANTAQPNSDEASVSSEQEESHVSISELLASVSPDQRSAVLSVLAQEPSSVSTLENTLMEIFDFSEPVLVAKLVDSFFAQSAKTASSSADQSLDALIPLKPRSTASFHSTATTVAESLPSTHPWDELTIKPYSAVPAAVSLVRIDAFPASVQSAFPNVTMLNAVQSAVVASVYDGSRNVLISAPTGSGKTNIAVLAMYAPDSHFLGSEEAPEVRICVYLAPMKALVKEVVDNLKSRFGTTVDVLELSGDSSESVSGLRELKKVIIVATPEKWDVVSRKMSNKQLEQVKLLIIDEIHLLNEVQRGPVLEFVVARHRAVGTRMLGLSATIPNAGEIAKFLDHAECIVFGPEYRPVRLSQKYLGIHKSKSAVERVERMNEACYEEVIMGRGEYGVIVFVHSRRDTGVTGRWLRDRAISRESIGWLVGDEGSRVLIEKEVQKLMDAGLIGADNRELLKYGIGVHNAGLKPEERRLVESLFADGHVKVLVSTLTLAVGVNLPARKVIIKGTSLARAPGCAPQDPPTFACAVPTLARGDCKDVSSMDMNQMLGRAGRPQYDTQGEGVVITKKEDLGRIMAMVNGQVEIESGINGERMAEGLNAEIARGGVRNVEEGVEWMKRLFYYQRCQTHVEENMIKVFDYLEAKSLIAKSRVRDQVRYKSTPIGRIISDYYLRFRTYSIFESELRADMDEGRIIEVFAQAEEFNGLIVRPEEEPELARIAETLPIPVTKNEVRKVSVLLQSHIGKRIQANAVFADLPHVTGTAARLLRALAELAIRKGFAETAKVALKLAKAAEAQMWPVGHSPLRQVPGALEIAKRVEKRGLGISEMTEMDVESLGQAVKAPKLGAAIHKLVKSLPRLQVSLAIQPVGRSLLAVEAEVTGDWIAGFCKHETFWVLIECGEARRILFSEKLHVSAQQTKTIKLTLPLFDPLHAVYFFRAVSDRFFVEDCVVPLRLDQLVLPPKVPKFRSADAARALIDEADISNGLVVSVGDPELAKMVVDRVAREEIPNVAVVMPEDWTLEFPGWRARRASEWELATRQPKERRDLFAQHQLFLCLGVDELDWHYEVFLGRAKEEVKLVCVSGNQFPNIADLGVWIGIEGSLSFGLLTPRDLEIETKSSFRSEDILAELEFIQSDNPHLTVVASGRLARELLLDDVLAVEALKLGRVSSFPGAVALVEDREFTREELNAILRCLVRGQRIYVFCAPGRALYLEKYFTEGISVESSLDQHLSDVFATPVAYRSVQNKQDAVEMLTYTYLYQRVQKNPNFYGLTEVSADALSAWLSEAVELGVESSGGFFSIGEDDFEISPTPLTHIAARHLASIPTMAVLTSELPNVARKKQLIGLLAKVTELKDERTAGALLVSWLRRQSGYYRIREISVSLLETFVDVAVSMGNIKVALFSVELMAAFEQAVEPGTSSLQQLPFFDMTRVQKAKELFGIQDVLEIGDLSEEDRATLFEGLSESEIAAVAQFCNDVFPSIQLSISVSGCVLSINISDQGEAKWWLFVAEQETQEIVSFRRLQVSDSIIEVTAPRSGSYSVYAMCGSFVGCDVEEQVQIDA